MLPGASAVLAARFRLLALVPDHDAIAVALDLPDRERGQRRRADGFAAAQIETGVMPRTADALPDDEPLGERPVIMTAMRVDRENLLVGAHQHNILVADMSEQRLAGELA